MLSLIKRRKTKVEQWKHLIVKGILTWPESDEFGSRIAYNRVKTDFMGQTNQENPCLCGTFLSPQISGHTCHEMRPHMPTHRSLWIIHFLNYIRFICLFYPPLINKSHRFLIDFHDFKISGVQNDYVKYVSYIFIFQKITNKKIIYQLLGAIN